jgi:hypothetical protein
MNWLADKTAGQQIIELQNEKFEKRQVDEETS